MDFWKTHFGTRLKQARKKRGLSQAQLGEALGELAVDASSVSRWETGRDMPDQRRLSKIFEILEVGENYFIPNAPPNHMVVKAAEATYGQQAPKIDEIKGLIEPLYLTQKESDLVSGFRLLTDKGKDIILSQLEAALDKHRRALLSRNAK